MMRSGFLKWLVIVLLTAFFLWFFLRSVSWSDTWSYLKQVKPLFLVFSVLLSTLHFVTRSIRWKFLLRPLKSDLKVWSAIEANVVGFTVILIFPGRVGEVVRPLYLARKEGLSSGYLVGTIVVERTFDIFTNCFLLGAFLLTGDALGWRLDLKAETYNQLLFWGKAGLLLTAFLFLMVIGLYFMKDRASGLFSFLARLFPKGMRLGVEKFGLEFLAGLKFFHSFPRLIAYFGLSIMVWLGICFFYWVFFLAYDFRIPFFMIVPYIFLTMVGASIPTPGMAGGFDYFSRLALTGLYGLDPNQAVGLTILIHSIQVLVTCLLGYVILWQGGLNLFQVRKLSEGKS